MKAIIIINYRKTVFQENSIESVVLRSLSEACGKLAANLHQLCEKSAASSQGPGLIPDESGRIRTGAREPPRNDCIFTEISNENVCLGGPPGPVRDLSGPVRTDPGPVRTDFGRVRGTHETMFFVTEIRSKT